jgi:hypothetical protein
MWIRNNWRSNHNSRSLVQKERKKSKVDVVWEVMKPTVVAKINEMTQEDEGRNATDVDLFNRRTTACSQVYHGLSLDQKADIDIKVKEGYDEVPVDIKQR